MSGLTLLNLHLEEEEEEEVLLVPSIFYIIVEQLENSHQVWKIWVLGSLDPKGIQTSIYHFPLGENEKHFWEQELESRFPPSQLNIFGLEIFEQDFQRYLAT